MLGEELSPGTPGATRAARARGVVFVADPLGRHDELPPRVPRVRSLDCVVVDGVLTAGVVRHGVTGDAVHRDRRAAAPIANGSVAVSSIDHRAGPCPHRHGIPVLATSESLKCISRSSPPWRARPPASGARARRRSIWCDVAAGRFEGFWELTLAPWDIAAGILLVREAGGIVTDLAGATRPGWAHIDRRRQPGDPPMAARNARHAGDSAAPRSS